MNKRDKILIVDDERIVRESLFHWFSEAGYYVTTAENGEIALKNFIKEKFDLLLIDMKMPGIGGLELLKRVKDLDKDVIVIMITAFASVSSAITALKDGAYDYVTKPVDPDELTHLVTKAIEQRNLKRENKLLKENLEEISRSENIIGESFLMNKVHELINTAASTDSSVMIRGECGTGKELVAKTIHSKSKNKYFPFISIKCGALCESSLEKELFGEDIGTSNGNQIIQKGKFELAEGGTLYLDEVNSISSKLQIEILKVLETKQFSRIGNNIPINTSFRLITASTENLEALVKEGKFREELFYKINVFSISLPPLRERNEDILLLANWFIKKISTRLSKPLKEISKNASEFLINYDWPGNVRELENAIERAIVIGKEKIINVDDLPFRVASIEFDLNEDKKSLSAIEKRHILKILNENKWNISRAANILEIDRVTLYNKINKYNLQRISK